MTPTRHNILWLPLLLLMLCIGACRSDSSEPDAPEEWDPELRLLLRIYTADTGSRMSRAVADPPDDYEYPSLNSEKLQTLRVIVVNDQPGSDDYGKVMHNCIESLTYLANNYTFRQSFKVEFSTKYKIYLIGNERGITGISNPDDPEDTDYLRTLLTNTLLSGKTYPTGCLENLIMAVSAPGAPLIDNVGVTDPLPVPVTEMYEIATMPRPQTEAQTVSCTEERRFFLTRAASKFSFSFHKGTDFEGTSNFSKIKYIKISGLGTKEYLLPHDTEYIPAKYNPDGSVKEASRRYITSFELPSPDPTGDYVFTLPDLVDIGNLSEAGYSYSPQLYFPESKGVDELARFDCSISYDGVNFIEAQSLNNLDIMPRNTHVKVNITVNAYDIVAEVEVLPYQPVDLMPGFGIERE